MIKKRKLPKADLIEKSVEGHFECIIRDKHGEIVERFTQHNLITLNAYKQLLSIIAGDKKHYLSKFILGTDGIKANGEPKGDKEGFNMAVQDLFSVKNSKAHYITTWEKTDNTAQGITNIATTPVYNEAVNEETEQPKVEVYFDSASSRVYFKYHLPLSCGNLTDNTRTTSYNEAGLYINDKLFAMKTFKSLTKSYNKSMDIIWSFKTVGDSADGIEFRIDTTMLSSETFILPMKHNTHPIIIEWGDGTEETVIEAGAGNKALDAYKHKYDAKGEFSIRILTQAIPNFDFTDLGNDIKESLVSIDSVTSPFQTNEFNGMFEGCVNLRSIPYSLFKYNVNATEFNNTFKGCENLAGVPSNLFIINSNIESAVSTFEGCTKAYIPLSVFSPVFVDKFKDNPKLVKNLWLGTIPSIEFTVNLKDTNYKLPFDKEYGLPSAMIVDFGTAEGVNKPDDREYKYFNIQSEELGFIYNTDEQNLNITISVYTIALPKFKFTKDVDNDTLVSIGRSQEPFISVDIEDLSGMFKDCINLETVNIDLFARNQQLKNVSSMFENCKKLKYASFINNTVINNFTRTWYNCYSMKIDQNILNENCVKETTKFGYMCYRDKLDISEPGTAPMVWTEDFIGSDEDELAFGGQGNINLTNWEEIPDLMKHTFMAIKVDLHKIDIDLKLHYNRLVNWGDKTASRGGRHVYDNLGEYTIKIYGVQDIQEWNTLGSDLPHIVKEIINIGDIRLPTSHTFEGFYKLERVPEELFLRMLEEVTSFDYAFAGCESLEYVPDLTGVTDKLVSVNRMFDGCMKLKKIPEGLFTAQGIETMDFCFRDCDALTEITGQLTSPKLKSVQGLFYECSNILTIPADFFGTTVNTITDYNSMFFRCKQLIIPEGLLKGFSTSPLQDVNVDNMFNLSRVFEGMQIEEGSVAPSELWSEGGLDRIASYKSLFAPNEVWKNLVDIPEDMLLNGTLDNSTYLLELHPYSHAKNYTIEVPKGKNYNIVSLPDDVIKTIEGKVRKEKRTIGYSNKIGDCHFTLKDYSFYEWCTLDEKKTTHQWNGSIINNDMSLKNIKLGVVWIRLNYTIVFDVNSGYWNGNSKELERMVEHDPNWNTNSDYFAFSVPTRKKFKLLGDDVVKRESEYIDGVEKWSTVYYGNSQDNATHYLPGEEIEIGEGEADKLANIYPNGSKELNGNVGSMRLYPIFRYMKVTFKFHANNEDVTNTMEDVELDMGKSHKAPLNMFTAEKWYFKLWATEVTSTTEYASGAQTYQENSNYSFTDKNKREIEVFAVWGKKVLMTYKASIDSSDIIHAWYDPRYSITVPNVNFVNGKSLTPPPGKTEFVRFVKSDSNGIYSGSSITPTEGYVFIAEWR